MTSKTGLYIHIPYCAKKCTYCNFYSAVPDKKLRDGYINRILKELKRWGAQTVCPIDTIYLGGGTPSLLSPAELEKIFCGIHENFKVDKCAEITCEVNPSDDLDPFISKAVSLGVNRISVGLQSANEEELSLLGRRYGFSDAKAAVELIKSKGIYNISLDLMLGLPSGSIEKLDNSIDAALSLSPSHISAYILKIEEGTPLHAVRNKLELADEDEVCDQYLHLCKRLEEQGFRHYEVSNFAKVGAFSRHNSRYWKGEEYIGIGPSAYSYFKGERFHYPANTALFISDGKTVFDERGGSLEEFVMLRLRLKEGLDLNKLSKKFNIKLCDRLYKRITQLEKAGLCSFENDKMQLTDEGMLVSNSIILNITEELI